MFFFVEHLLSSILLLIKALVVTMSLSASFTAADDRLIDMTSMYNTSTSVHGRALLVK